jgi:protein-S-isoprenylcysteine O-methyltransferase Ste14
MSSTTPVKNHPGVIAPPPLIFTGFLAAGLVANYFVAIDWRLADLWRVGAGGFLCAAAVIFLAPALGLFRKAGTRAEPWRPTTAIVTSGIYALTRNVGMALAYAGLGLLAGSLAALILLPAAILVIHRGVILREEAYLTQKFGDEYLRYKARVRRWL